VRPQGREPTARGYFQRFLRTKLSSYFLVNLFKCLVVRFEMKGFAILGDARNHHASSFEVNMDLSFINDFKSEIWMCHGKPLLWNGTPQNLELRECWRFSFDQTGISFRPGLRAALYGSLPLS